MTSQKNWRLLNEYFRPILYEQVVIYIYFLISKGEYRNIRKQILVPYKEEIGNRYTFQRETDSLGERLLLFPCDVNEDTIQSQWDITDVQQLVGPDFLPTLKFDTNDDINIILRQKAQKFVISIKLTATL